MPTAPLSPIQPVSGMIELSECFKSARGEGAPIDIGSLTVDAYHPDLRLYGRRHEAPVGRAERRDCARGDTGVS